MNTLPESPLTDDQLGALLGDSVRGRVDAVPTPTPSFNGVERRARQITNRRRGAAGLAVGALALFAGIGAAALVDDDEGATENDVVTEPAPVEDDTVADIEEPVTEPTVTDGARVTGLIDNVQFIAVDDTGTETELLAVSGDERITNAVLLADGSILAVITDSLTNPNRQVVHIPGVGAEPIVLSEHGHLAGGAVVDGTPYAFVGDLVDVADDFSFEPTPLRAVDLRDHSSIDLIDEAFGIEWAVAGVDVLGDKLLVESFDEAGWTWELRSLDPTVEPTPVSSGTWNDDLQRLAPRFDRSGAALYWWIEHDPATGGHWLVNGFASLEAAERVPLDVTDARLDLEVTDGAIVINLLDPATGLGAATGDATTIWVDPATLDPSLENEPGVIRFVEPGETTTPPVDTADG